MLKKSVNFQYTYAIVFFILQFKEVVTLYFLDGNEVKNGSHL